MAGEKAQTKEAGAKEAGELGFDERLARLEAIVVELEQGGIGLERSIERYQEGIEHLRLCHRTLESFKKRVEELGEDARDALRPFEGDPDAQRE